MSAQSDKDRKAFQSYLANIKAKTGLTPADFRRLAKEKGLTKAGEVVAWLQKDYGLGYGHAGAIWQVIGHAADVKASEADKIARLFAGQKTQWRKPYDAFEAKVRQLGTDVEIAPNMSYINLVRGTKKFGIVQVTAKRLDIGIKLKSVAPTDRFEAAGSWNALVTHRVRVTDPKQIDKEVLAWLKRAYDAAG
jgi:predicted transport protein